jgi:hypothetical protein
MRAKEERILFCVFLRLIEKWLKSEYWRCADIFQIQWYDPTRLSIDALNMLNG